MVQNYQTFYKIFQNGLKLSKRAHKIFQNLFKMVQKIEMVQMFLYGPLWSNVVQIGPK